MGLQTSVRGSTRKIYVYTPVGGSPVTFYKGLHTYIVVHL